MTEKLHPILEALNDYLSTATEKQLRTDWEELKQYNECGPEMRDVLQRALGRFEQHDVEQQEKAFRTFVTKFVKEHINEVEYGNKRFSETNKYMYESLGFTSRTNMLNSIKNNTKDAAWAFEELMTWGMSTDYTSKYEVGTIERGRSVLTVYHIDGIGHFTLDIHDEFKAVSKKKQVIEVFEIESHE